MQHLLADRRPLKLYCGKAVLGWQFRSDARECRRARLFIAIDQKYIPTFVNLE
jgi:hypothetical protein